MNNKYSSVVLATMLIGGALSIAGCTKHEDKVHESWVAPPAGEVVDDSTLTNTIKSSLLSDPVVKNLDVKIEAHNGEVMLSGVVDNQAQMDRVIMFAWMAQGIKKVDNKMSLKSGGAGVSN
ncbi:MAG: BON domain-containing protein [Pseudomonadota bacterium]|nr:BON domain-containing protein [Pseudomonadota bacterium]